LVFPADILFISTKQKSPDGCSGKFTMIFNPDVFGELKEDERADREGEDFKCKQKVVVN
jgi:hypothetical protein